MIIIASVLRFGFDITYVVSKVINDGSFSDNCPDFKDIDIPPEIAFNIC